jgi:cell division protein ZipA
MAELRWILLIIGAAIVGGIYLWSRYQSDADESVNDPADSGSEPTVDSATDAKSRDRANFASSTSTDEAVTGDTGGATVIKRKSRTRSSGKPVTYKDLSGDEKIISLRVTTKDGSMLEGMKVVKALMDVGLMHGSFKIFHRMLDNTEIPVFSVASLIEPGTFDLSKVEDMATQGLTFFMVLPGADDGVVIFEDMLSTARDIAERLKCELLDETGSALTAQGAEYIKEDIIQYQHQHS